MAEAITGNNPSLSEQYFLGKEEKQEIATKPMEVKEVEKPVIVAAEEVATEKVEEAAPVTETNAPPAAVEENSSPAVEESAPHAAEEEGTGSNPAALEDGTENEPAAEESSEESQEAAEETTEIKLETAPADFRFPTTNQTRHCFARYVEYHRCVAAKGEGASECDKFAKYYRALCPGEWVEKWNEQRENGTFPGPL